MQNMHHKKSFVMLEEQNHNFAQDKTRPIKGYLKIETGGERGAVRIGADNLRYFERGGYVYKLLFFGKKNEKTIYKIVGSLLLSSRGRGETYLRLNPVDVDGKGNGLEHFQIAVVAAVSTTDSREPLHPILRGDMEEKEKIKCQKSGSVTYNQYYNQYILECCGEIENKREMYDRTVPFKEDKTDADWIRVVNLGRFPMVSPGARYMISRYRHFIFGTDFNYYYIGVPGRFLEQEQPDQGRSGFVLWQPILGAEGYHADAKDAPLKNRQVAYGYWIAAINRKTGEIESPFGAEN
ncbi:hypothetical protein [Zhenpiania hominis]|uniref:Uncharacterized protein n=1 Tax=Zhenpiania hominis TaxID=2763644 RepID=A0A923NQ25_9FIRM|nr:hypothetical protein [Zhenpiania hominis]MBC6680615.1 hypothetical protein [Zhenpiania hominis]